MSMRLLIECARARPDDGAIRRAAAAVDDWTGSSNKPIATAWGRCCAGASSDAPMWFRLPFSAACATAPRRRRE